jgi:methionine-rich copper-binding protein CopC
MRVARQGRVANVNTGIGETIMKTFLAGAVALSLAFGLAAEASAHAKLVKSDPPAGGAAKDNKTVELTFNEEISGKLSGAVVKDSAGKTVPSSAMVDQNGKGLMVMMKDPLKAGAYKVDWHAVASDDGHRTTGSLAFNAK